MFSTEQLVDDCRLALQDSTPGRAVKEVVRRAMGEPAQVLAALGTPTHAGLFPILQSPTLTILNVVWAPGMAIYPHDHRMWTVIGATHSVLGAAAAVVMARFFGTDQIAFTMTSGAPFAGITRSFTSLSQAARENADSRVLGGVHFRSACEAGLALGERIGRLSIAQHLQRHQP
jgi:hypothetical protein